ncbi:GatB/YqeY domain-containing protein [Candidatus Dojkabacteria bacterium]|uniref:GatB/YqeY domain-containing protein n=1 Tax=Candidatus Dojkabacteria bacterium TaxID=2099670 RepID=A0A847VDJ5_9BACT|nr:GatB/YqeY domain-containing protein [Candidatus Dojkabacteria bacterium]
MSLIQDIRKDIFESSKAGSVERVNILKIVLADIKNEGISQSKSLTDGEILQVLGKQRKKVRDSISQFKQMGREDLVNREAEQLEVLNEYLPAMMSKEDISKVIKRVIESTGAQDLKDMGKVMGLAMKELNGKAEGDTVKEIVQGLLT